MVKLKKHLLFLLTVFVGFSYIAGINGFCLYNSTHCQCAHGNENGLENGNCLRYLYGSGSSTTCSVDACSSLSYKCDCMGGSICALEPCTSWKKSESQSSGGSGSSTGGSQTNCHSETGVCVKPPTIKISTPCIQNSTHCQCASRNDGGLCLRFLSGSSSSATCVVEDCLGGGHKCDCMGTEMCELKTCGKWSSTSSLSSLKVGEMVSCLYNDGSSQAAGLCPSVL